MTRKAPNEKAHSDGKKKSFFFPMVCQPCFCSIAGLSPRLRGLSSSGTSWQESRVPNPDSLHISKEKGGFPKIVTKLGLGSFDGRLWVCAAVSLSKEPVCVIWQRAKLNSKVNFSSLCPSRLQQLLHEDSSPSIKSFGARGRNWQCRRINPTLRCCC